MSKSPRSQAIDEIGGLVLSLNRRLGVSANKDVLEALCFIVTAVACRIGNQSVSSPTARIEEEATEVLKLLEEAFDFE